MERHALAFRIKEGSQDAVAELLQNYAAPQLVTDDGTRLIGTSVFLKDDLVVRVIEIEGEMSQIGPHLSRDPVIQQVERALVPHLVEAYDPRDPGQRAQLFARRATQQLVHRGESAPSGSRHALLYPVRAERSDIAAQVLVRAGDPPLHMGDTRLWSTSIFRQGDVLVRVFEIEGDIDELLTGLSQSIEVAGVGDRMAGLFTGDYDFRTRSGLEQFFGDNLMRTVTDRRAAMPVDSVEKG